MILFWRSQRQTGQDLRGRGSISLVCSHFTIPSSSFSPCLNGHQEITHWRVAWHTHAHRNTRTHTHGCSHKRTYGHSRHRGGGIIQWARKSRVGRVYMLSVCVYVCVCVCACVGVFSRVLALSVAFPKIIYSSAPRGGHFAFTLPWIRDCKPAKQTEGRGEERLLQRPECV